MYQGWGYWRSHRRDERYRYSDERGSHRQHRSSRKLHRKRKYSRGHRSPSYTSDSRKSLYNSREGGRRRGHHSHREKRNGSLQDDVGGQNPSYSPRRADFPSSNARKRNDINREADDQRMMSSSGEVSVIITGTTRIDKEI
jgi:hypothetical protein